MLYKVLKNMIVKKNYNSKEELQTKLDVFYATGRLTQEQYEELTAMLAEA